MPTIRIDDEVWSRLKNEAEPFVDTPNDVLRRMLQLGPRHRTQTKQTERSRYLNLFPRTQFFRPILEAIIELGGRGRTDDVLQIAYRKVKARLSADDLRPNESGEPKWRNSARWAREQLVKELNPPLLDPAAPYGWWEITEQGRKFLQRD